MALVLNSSWQAFNFRYNLGLSLKEQGYDIIFIAPYSSYSEKLKKDFKFIDLSLSTNGTNPITDYRTVLHLYKIYKELKPAIVLNFTIKPNIYSTIVASYLNIPSINNIAGLGSLFIEDNFKTILAKKMYKFSQKRASKIFFQNNDDFKLFLDEKIVEKNKCDRLPGSGVDLNKFAPIKKKDSNNFKFLLVSRMLWPKGVKEYIEASKIIKNSYPNVEFLLLGFLDEKSPTAISKEQMDVWVKDYPINYMGVSDNVREVISDVDCMVLPSYYREGVPRILLESASMAKPIITTYNVGCKEVVDHEVNGYLCKIKDVNDLAKQMEKMLNLTKEERIFMGENSRRKAVSEFDEKIVLNKYLESVKQILY